jgi:hypothetical protein
MRHYKLNKKKFAAFIGDVLAAAAFIAVFVGGPLAIIASM